jgi:hypothetical protein
VTTQASAANKMPFRLPIGTVQHQGAEAQVLVEQQWEATKYDDHVVLQRSGQRSAIIGENRIAREDAKAQWKAARTADRLAEKRKWFPDGLVGIWVSTLTDSAGVFEIKVFPNGHIRLPGRWGAGLAVVRALTTRGAGWELAGAALIGATDAVIEGGYRAEEFRARLPGAAPSSTSTPPPRTTGRSTAADQAGPCLWSPRACPDQVFRSASDASDARGPVTLFTRSQVLGRNSAPGRVAGVLPS